MKQILIITNIPSPYRVRFFDELSRFCQLTVLYAERNEDDENRDAAWYIPSQGRFQEVFLQRRVKIGGQYICLDVLDWLKKPFDKIVMFGYGLPTYMLAITWLRLHRKEYAMELDGCLEAEQSLPKLALKRFLVGGANCWFSSGRITDDVLCQYGANKDRIIRYPFTSLSAADIFNDAASRSEKECLKEELGIAEKNVILAVGQFIPRKGFDVLLRAAKDLLPDTGIYFVGGEPTPEYLELARSNSQTPIHFVGFRKKEALVKYYRAADVFVLPTREDIWGLVINEAMACGLPVVTTNRCVAGLELVEDGVNGFLVPAEDEKELTEKINTVLQSDRIQMGRASLDTILPYTMEEMAIVHKNAFEK